jgi:hypothetical protein
LDKISHKKIKDFFIILQKKYIMDNLKIGKNMETDAKYGLIKI